MIKVARVYYIVYESGTYYIIIWYTTGKSRTKTAFFRIIRLNIIVGFTLCTQYYARRGACYKHIVCIYMYIYVRVGRLQTIINRVVAEVFIKKKNDRRYALPKSSTIIHRNRFYFTRCSSDLYMRFDDDFGGRVTF